MTIHDEGFLYSGIVLPVSAEKHLSSIWANCLYSVIRYLKVRPSLRVKSADSLLYVFVTKWPIA